MANKLTLNQLRISSTAHICTSHCPEIKSVHLMIILLPISTSGDLTRCCTFYSSGGFKRFLNSFLLSTPMMFLGGLFETFQMPVMSLEGMLLSESDFCTNTSLQLVLRCYPCFFPNICKWRDPEGVVERRQGQ